MLGRNSPVYPLGGRLIGMLLLAGCASQASAEGQYSTVRTEVRARFTLEQEGNITTGYGWKPAYDDAFLRLENESDKATSDQLGAGGKFTFAFSALREGTTTVNLVCKRPWENEILRTQEYTVIIAPARKLHEVVESPIRWTSLGLHGGSK